MSNPPAFQYYPSDLLSDRRVIVMTTEEVGAYWLLTSVCWRDGALPDDLEEMAAVARMPTERFKKSWIKRISRCFEQNSEGEWINPMLEEQRRIQMENREKRRRAANVRHHGADSKPASATQVHDERSADAMQVHVHVGAGESPTSGNGESDAGHTESGVPPDAQQMEDSSSSTSSASSSKNLRSPKKRESVGAATRPASAPEATESLNEDTESLKPKMTEIERIVVNSVQFASKRRPRQEMWPMLIEAVKRRAKAAGTPEVPDVPRFKQCWLEWIERGLNSQSWKWATVWYVVGIPPPGVKAEEWEARHYEQLQGPLEVPEPPEARENGAGPAGKREARLSGADLGALADTVRLMVREQGRSFREVVEQLNLEALSQKDYAVVAKPVCPRCGGAGLESVPGKGARPCDHRVAAEMPARNEAKQEGTSDVEGSGGDENSGGSAGDEGGGEAG